MPTGNTANASEKGLMTENGLTEEAREVDVLPDLKHNSLITVSKLSDTGYTTVFQPNDGDVWLCTGRMTLWYMSRRK